MIFFYGSCLSYHKRGSSSYVLVRRKGNSPIRVVAGERFRTKRAKIAALRRSQLRNDFSSYLFENRNLFMFEWIVKYELSYSYITVTPNNFGKGIY